MIADFDAATRSLAEAVARRTIRRQGFLGLLGRAASAAAAAAVVAGAPRAAYAQCGGGPYTLCGTSGTCQESGSYCAPSSSCPSGRQHATICYKIRYRYCEGDQPCFDACEPTCSDYGGWGECC